MIDESNTEEKEILIAVDMPNGNTYMGRVDESDYIDINSGKSRSLPMRNCVFTSTDLPDSHTKRLYGTQLQDTGVSGKVLLVNLESVVIHEVE